MAAINAEAIGPVSSVVDADLVDRIYASAMEPDRHHELMCLWRLHVADPTTIPAAGARLTTGGRVEGATKRELHRHFARAFEIIERLGRDDKERSSIETLVRREYRPAMIVSQDGRITLANDPSQRLLGVTINQNIDQFPIDVDGLRNLRSALQDLEAQTPERLLAIARISAPALGHDLVLALSRAPRPAGAPALGVLKVADLRLSIRIGEILIRGFGLSEAECDVARALVEGETARDIAHSRDRSLETIRTQIKSILRKVDVHSQSDLIRLLAALVQLDLAGSDDGSAQPSSARGEAGQA